MHRSLFHSRRTFLQSTAAAAIAWPLLSRAAAAAEFPPARAITRGPKHHWFGYYDKLEFDPTNRFVLSNEVDFEHRTPRPDDEIGVGMVDLENEDRWIPLGSSRAWGWQQGCMFQWRPGSANEVVWNDREADRHVCRVLNVETREIRTLPRPVYALSPDGKFAITAEFARIQRMRPGYGYSGVEEIAPEVRAPKDSGVWRMDLETGESELIFSLAEAAAIPFLGDTELESRWHWFNHLLVSPNSSRFIVLHRWRKESNSDPANRNTGGFTTRMFTADVDGGNRYILDPSGFTSHFIWRDPEHICAWTKPLGRKAAFYLFRDQSEEIEIVGDGVMTENGHNTYLPQTNNEWILNDTYPDSARRQKPYLFHVPSGRRVELGAFVSPKEYSGEWRCDTHPRSSNDGLSVVIDSPHPETGRQLHLIDLRGLLG